MHKATDQKQAACSEEIFQGLGFGDLIEFNVSLHSDLEDYLDSSPSDTDRSFLDEILEDFSKRPSLTSINAIFNKIIAYDESCSGNTGKCIRELLAIRYQQSCQQFFPSDSTPTKRAILHQMRTFDPLTPIEQPPNRDELVQLLISDINKSFRDSDCYFLNTDPYLKIPMQASESMEDHDARKKGALFQELDKIIEGSPGNRIQVIIRTGPHYLTLDIDKEKCSCFIIDAAGNARQNDFLDVTQFSSHIQKVAYIPRSTISHPEDASKTVNVILQASAYGCFLFALDHARHVANIDNIHETILENPSEERSDVYEVSWFRMNPEMVKNSQSTQVITAYKASASEEDRDRIDELTANNTKGYGFGKTRDHYMGRSSQLCHEKDESDIANMVSLAVAERRRAHDFHEYKDSFQQQVATSAAATSTEVREDDSSSLQTGKLTPGNKRK